MTLRRIRHVLLAYVVLDLLLGYAGFIPLTELAAAQFTQVSGNVTDPNGLPYALGTISAILVTSASPTLNGFAYTPPTQPTGIDLTGSFTMQLADNAVLLPAGTKWNFVVCSGIGTVQPTAGKGPVCFTLAAPITITGTSQSISANLNAVAPSLITTPASFQSTLYKSTGAGGGTCNAPQNGFFVSPFNSGLSTFGANTVDLCAFGTRVIQVAAGVGLVIENANLVFSSNKGQHITPQAATSDIAGVLTCAASTASLTFTTAYTSTPVIVVSDETTSGGARVSAKSNTAFTITCSGATDVVDYMTTGNPN